MKEVVTDLVTAAVLFPLCSPIIAIMAALRIRVFKELAR